MTKDLVKNYGYDLVRNLFMLVVTRFHLLAMIQLLSTENKNVKGMNKFYSLIYNNYPKITIIRKNTSISILY